MRQRDRYQARAWLRSIDVPCGEEVPPSEPTQALTSVADLMTMLNRVYGYVVCIEPHDCRLSVRCIPTPDRADVPGVVALSYKGVSLQNILSQAVIHARIVASHPTWVTGAPREYQWGVV